MNTSISFATLMLLLLANTGLLGQPPQPTARSRSIRDIVSELRRFHGEENRDSEVLCRQFEKWSCHSILVPVTNRQQALLTRENRGLAVV
jgi:hypothetical protein